MTHHFRDDSTTCKCLDASADIYGCFASVMQTRGLSLRENLIIRGCIALTTLPEGLRVSGNLDLRNCKRLHTLPTNLQVDGNLWLGSCDSLMTFPSGLSVTGDLDISGCINLATLPSDLRVGGNLNALRCKRLGQISTGPEISGRLRCHLGCLPPDLNYSGNLEVWGHGECTELPPGLVVSGDLHVYYAKMSTLPNDLEIGRDLKLVHCCRLDHLPAGFVVPGCLEIFGASALTTMPCGLRVGGSLSLRSCVRLTTFSSGIQIGDSLRLSYCHDLTSLPSDLSVARSIFVDDCFFFHELPNDLTVMDNLTISRVVRLPDNLRVLGDLEVHTAGVMALPTTLQVGGNLTLSRLYSLYSLPNNLVVNGDLTIKHCKLESLPEGLVVKGSLLLTDCRHLQHFPEGISVGGDLHLRGCDGLRNLPQDLISWGQTSAAHDRVIDLTGTNMSPQVQARLASCATVGLHFIFAEPEPTASDRERANPSTALSAWLSQSLHGSSKFRESCQLDVEQELSVGAFLSRLCKTAEYRNRETRTSLMQRVNDLLKALQESPSLWKVCSERISHAMESCTDRVILLMNQLELAVKVHTAQTSQLCAKELKALGTGLLKLEVVHRHAAATCKRLTFVDEVEIYLKYETRLRDSLSLPVSTSNMLYGAEVTPEELELARQDALLTAANSQKSEAFFSTWEPWLRHERTQLANKYSYKRLPTIKLRPDQGLICPFTQEPLYNLHQPVLLLITGQICVYESAHLVAWWREHGRQPAPAPQLAFELSELRRVVGFKRRDSACYVRQRSNGAYNTDFSSDPANDASQYDVAG